MFCQSAASDEANCAERIPDTDTAKGGFAGSLEGDAAEKFVLIHCMPGGEISDYIYTGRGSESLEAACDFKLYLYIMCLQGSALDMSQKQGCKVQIKPLTEEVTNYQLIGIALKLTVIP